MLKSTKMISIEVSTTSSVPGTYSFPQNSGTWVNSAPIAMHAQSTTCASSQRLPRAELSMTDPNIARSEVRTTIFHPSDTQHQSPFQVCARGTHKASGSSRKDEVPNTAVWGGGPKFGSMCSCPVSNLPT